MPDLFAGKLKKEIVADLLPALSVPPPNVHVFLGPEAPVTALSPYLFFRTDASGRVRLFIEDGV